MTHLIGLKLSQKYRFAEGAAHQRQALRFDPNYLPAKAQLAQDLLRLGEEAEGWRLAEEVHEQDGYDVDAPQPGDAARHDGKFATLTNAHFIVRMSAARGGALRPAGAGTAGAGPEPSLCAKYGLELDQPVLVEIFPEQKDFAVRTFGMPENHGFLGVCFGPVITANSPASRPGQRVQLGGHALARVLSRRHAATHAQQDAALAERGHFGLRGAPGQSRLGRAHESRATAR